MPKSFIKRIVSSTKSRDFRSFLLFLLLSFFVWHFEKLRQNYTLNIPLDIVCTNVPDGYIVPPDLPNKVETTIEGDGLSIMQMMLTRRHNVEVDLKPLHRYTTKGQNWAIYIPHRLLNQHTDIPEHIKIVDVLTDTVMIPLLTVKEKKLPIVVRERVALKSQFLYSAPRKIIPDSLIVVATNDIIDTLSAIYTVIQTPTVLSDTMTETLDLEIPPKVETDVSKVRVEYFVEPFTEKSITIPIKAVNSPGGYRCKIFPSTAKVTFSVGLSLFDDIDEGSIKVIADFSGIRPGGKETRVRVKPILVPDRLQNVSVSPSFAGFLLEKER